MAQVKERGGVEESAQGLGVTVRVGGVGVVKAVSEKMFSALGASVCSKINRAGEPPGPFSWICHCFGYLPDFLNFIFSTLR